jgi:hypothetical protein
MFAARVADPDKLQDDLDTMESSGNGLSNALSQFNQAPTTTNAGQLATALESFRGALATVNNKTLEGNLFVSPLTIGVPGKDLGWAVYASARADVGAKLFFDGNDNTLLAGDRDAVQTYAGSAGTLADLNALVTDPRVQATGTTLNDPSYQSHLDVRGAAFGEFGVSLAHEFQEWDKLAVGITPKYVRVYTFDYSVNPQRSEITIDKGRKDYASGNFDIGLAKELGSGFKAGFVGKNMVPRTYTTALGNDIDVKPQLRAGVSHHTSSTTVALDVDLTENKPLAFDKATRYAGIGAELNAWDILYLRAGYRADLSGNYKGIPSVGLGLSIFGLHLDAAVAGRNKEEVMAAVQLGLRF